MNRPNLTVGRILRAAQWGAARGLFTFLNVASPRIGGRLGARIWNTLPPQQSRARRLTHQPDGGRPIEVQVDGRRVRGRRYGPIEAPPVFLLHGWSGHWQQFSALIGPLVGAGWQVVGWDVLGHGDSDVGEPGRGHSSLGDFLACCRAFRDEIGDPHIVIGHSFGGLAALEATRRADIRPDALVLFAPFTRAGDLLAFLRGRAWIGERASRHMVRLIAERTGERVADVDAVAWAAAADDRPRLWLAHDHDDDESPAAGSIALHDAWPGSEIHVVRGLGHRRVLWDPALTGSALAFIGAPDGDD